jgi:hypothetical protein
MNGKVVSPQATHGIESSSDTRRHTTADRVSQFLLFFNMGVPPNLFRNRASSFGEAGIPACFCFAFRRFSLFKAYTFSR